MAPSSYPVSAPKKARLRYQTQKLSGDPAERSRIAANERLILSIIQELDDQLSLPFDINVSLEKCGGPDAFYGTESHQITICYEVIDAYYFIFLPNVKASRLDENVEGAVLTLFLHELGHALVDAWKLPVTGREEDAVDQLATLILINSKVDRERLALSGARAFKLLANLERHEKKFFWDEHSLDAQRHYDTICLIYGHDPKKYGYLVKDKTLPAERAEWCAEDYERIKNAWNQLLGPYAKQSLLSH
jgi:Putative metallopeptidase